MTLSAAGKAAESKSHALPLGKSVAPCPAVAERAATPTSIASGFTAAIEKVSALASAMSPAKMGCIKLSDPRGQPVSGLAFLVLHLDGRELARGVTDADGMALLADVPAGEISIVALSGEGAPGPAAPPASAAPVSPPDQEAAQLRAARFRFADAGGKPAAGLAFRVLDANDAEVASGLSGADGCASLEGLPAGALRIVAAA